MIDLLDLVGTFVFAISGALSGAKKRLDVLGMGVVAFVTAVGGGTIRDLILDKPVCWIQEDKYIYAILAGVLVAIFFQDQMTKLKRTFFVFDTIGIAVFTVIGTEKALSLEYSFMVALLLGVNSAVSGGIIRDTLCNDIPLIFHREVYASACLAGSFLYASLRLTSLDKFVITALAIAIIIAIRILAIQYKWSLPKSTAPQSAADNDIETN